MGLSDISHICWQSEGSVTKWEWEGKARGLFAYVVFSFEELKMDLTTKKVLFNRKCPLTPSSGKTML